MRVRGGWVSINGEWVFCVDRGRSVLGRSILGSTYVAILCFTRPVANAHKTSPCKFVKGLFLLA